MPEETLILQRDPDAVSGRHWLLNSFAAAFCGMVAHSLLMFLKNWMGLLPSFQPYEALQEVLKHRIGIELGPVAAWALSFISGATIVGFIFGRSYRRLPGKTGAVKGLVFGVIAWALMGSLFFPLIGLGFFGAQTGRGSAPALFSLAMLLTYSVVMGLVYAALSHPSSSTNQPP